MTKSQKIQFLTLFMLTVTACSSTPKNPPQENQVQVETAVMPPPPLMPAPPVAQTPVAPAIQTPTTDPATALHADASQRDVASNVKHAEHSNKAEHHREAGPVSADKALGWLKNGNTRYLKNKLRTDGQSSADRTRLSTGQKPHTIVLSCSDSRVPPEIVFDQKLGEIFVVRAAGEALDSSVIASIEYAVSHLGSNLILVMGHDSCGAVKAAHGTLGGEDAGSPSLNKLVRDIHPRIAQFKGKAMSPQGNDETWANVRGVAKDLVERSQIVRDLVAGGEVKIAEAVYHLQSGQVEWK